MKKIPGFQSEFSVYPNGKIYSHRKNKFVPSHFNKYGYEVVRLYDREKGKAFNLKVHRLVAEAFCDPPKLQVNHINGDKTDNRKENLEWVTHGENQRHAYKIGLQKSLKGEGHKWSKLTEKQVRKIKFSEKGSQGQIAKKYNVSQPCINEIKNNKTWKHITRGD